MELGNDGQKLIEKGSEGDCGEGVMNGGKWERWGGE